MDGEDGTERKLRLSAELADGAIVMRAGIVIKGGRVGLIWTLRCRCVEVVGVR